jgi:Raf kinase inhibitor-like YbhB/YbcL family protein
MPFKETPLNALLGGAVLAACAMLAVAAPRHHPRAAPHAGPPFALTSSDIAPGGTIPRAQVYKGYGCDGENISPELEWKNPPRGTKSFAITVHDPDASIGTGWRHWTVINIPPRVTRLETGAGNARENKLPPGAMQTQNDFETPGYGGPCPPQGDKPHHYVFTVIALKIASLEMRPDVSSAKAEADLDANTLARATMTAVYGR